MMLSVFVERELVELAKVELLQLHVAEGGQPWHGPVFQLLLDRLKISMRQLRFDYRDGKRVYYGHDSAIPDASMTTLMRLAKVHDQAYHLLRIVCADLLRGDQTLPPPIRDVCAGFILDEIPEPTMPLLKDRPTTSHHHWVRDQAICRTIAMLKAVHGITPTRSLSSKVKRLSGSYLVQIALAEISKSVEPSKRMNLGERSINSVWDDRAHYLSYEKAALKELANLGVPLA